MPALHASSCCPSAAATAQFPLLPPLQAGGWEMDKHRLSKLAPREQAGRLHVSPAFLRAQQQRGEDSIKITLLQMLWAPRQAWTHIYPHTSWDYFFQVLKVWCPYWCNANLQSTRAVFRSKALTNIYLVLPFKDNFHTETQAPCHYFLSTRHRVKPFILITHSWLMQKIYHFYGNDYLEVLLMKPIERAK